LQAVTADQSGKPLLECDQPANARTEVLSLVLISTPRLPRPGRWGTGALIDQEIQDSEAAEALPKFDRSW
jgi:hypothetical protein